MKLRTLNRFLRWTGWRIYVEVDVENLNNPLKCEPTQIGLVWYGWGFIRELKEDLKDTK